jgi:hypothetical protein
VPTSIGTAKLARTKIFIAFTGAARHMPPAGKDEALAIGYLLQHLLEHLRYRINRGYADAGKSIADFQADVSRKSRQDTSTGACSRSSGVLHHRMSPCRRIRRRIGRVPHRSERRRLASDKDQRRSYQHTRSLRQPPWSCLPSGARGALAGALALVKARLDSATRALDGTIAVQRR